MDLIGSRKVETAKKAERKQKGAFSKATTPNEDWMIPEECWQGNVWPALYLTV